jgi:hypothetical protein
VNILKDTRVVENVKCIDIDALRSAVFKAHSLVYTGNVSLTLRLNKSSYVTGV